MIAVTAPQRLRVMRLAALAASLFTLFSLSGCATAVVSYKTLPDAESRAAKLSPMVAPPQVEVFELSAGGVSEKRDDWTGQVTTHVTPLLASQTGYHPVPALTGEQKTAAEAELQEVVAMLQIVTVNHLVFSMGPPELQPQSRPLTYNLGRIDKLLDILGADSLLVSYVRDEYSTGGRKALMVLGVLAGAVTGVVVVPRGGITVNTAALVERDGTVVWFNYAGSGGDMRTPEGSSATMKMLLAGLPGHKSTTAAR